MGRVACAPFFQVKMDAGGRLLKARFETFEFRVDAVPFHAAVSIVTNIFPRMVPDG
jgi:hypothetical protein